MSEIRYAEFRYTNPVDGGPGGQPRHYERPGVNGNALYVFELPNTRP